MKKIAFLSFIIFTQSALALETDQFLAASHVIKDSSEAINDYVEDKFERAISRANNKRKQVTCQDLAGDVMTEIVGRFSISKISLFAKKSPSVDRFPDDSINDKDYMKQSMYREAGFPFNFAKISRTINIGGVYIGTDKLGHFALVGRNYYRRYLENLDEGMNKAQAEKASVLTGMAQEVHILGYTLGGVLSYGDLEANYQGMQFAISMCDQNHPYLIKEQGQWKRNSKRPFDIKNYINPKMDESYKPAFWKPRLWKKITPHISQTYCELKSNPLYIERMKSYQDKLEHNKNDDYIKEFFGQRPKFDRNLQLIDSLCK